MSQTAGFTKKHKTLLIVVLGLLSLTPVLFSVEAFSSSSWLPVWSGAAIAFLALLGLFGICWHAGMLRIRFLILFIIALGIAVAHGLA